MQSEHFKNRLIHAEVAEAAMANDSDIDRMVSSTTVLASQHPESGLDCRSTSGEEAKILFKDRAAVYAKEALMRSEGTITQLSKEAWSALSPEDKVKFVHHRLTVVWDRQPDGSYAMKEESAEKQLAFVQTYISAYRS